VPRLVRTEGGQWSEPVQVFSNTDEVVYVPDITTSSWAQWHEQDFKERGLYFTYVYTYWRKRQVTVRELVYVNTRTQQIRVERFLKSPVQIDLRTSPPTISKTVANITKIVQSSIEHFDGRTLQDAVQSQKALTLNNLNVIQEREQAEKNIPTLQPPRLINPVSPIYPADAWAKKITEVVTISVLVDAYGMPSDLQIVKSVYPSIDAAALQAANQYRFEPAHNTISGVPVPMRTTIDINFHAQ
jgi:TonB family protein